MSQDKHIVNTFPADLTVEPDQCYEDGDAWLVIGKTEVYIATFASKEAAEDYVRLCKQDGGLVPGSVIETFDGGEDDPDQECDTCGIMFGGHLSDCPENDG